MSVLIAHAMLGGSKGAGVLKSERFVFINDAVKARGVVTVREIMETCGVSDMTARRDLGELEASGRLVRVFGGARSVDYSLDHEYSHQEKTSHEKAEKLAIATWAAHAVQDQDILFLGPGTTVEALARALRGRDVEVVTTSHPVFMTLRDDERAQVLLVGGAWRAKTESFIGELAVEQVRSFRFSRAFISCNALFGDDVMSYSPSEGVIQRTALDNAEHRCLLADHTKFGRRDFYTYYHLSDLDMVVTDAGTDPDRLAEARSHAQVEVVPVGGLGQD